MSSQRPFATMQPTGAHTDIASQIYRFLETKHVPPTQTWLQSFSSSVRPSTPIQAIQKTALFRMLSTDLTNSINPTANSVLNTDISNPEVREINISGPVTLQVLDIEDISKSRWSQVEAIEAQERGEFTRGREVIRVGPDESDEVQPSIARSTDSIGPHKLLLQDARGTKVYGIELKNIKDISTSMPIGSKLIIRNALVARGVLLLEPETVELLGGKIEDWDRKWRQDRKAVLKEKAGMDRVNGG